VPHAQTEIQDKLRDVCLTIDAADWFDLREPIVNDIDGRPAAQGPKALPGHGAGDVHRAGGIELEAFNAAAKTIECLQLAAGAAYTDETGTAWKGPTRPSWRLWESPS
jgi:hypothetical protein